MIINTQFYTKYVKYVNSKKNTTHGSRLLLSYQVFIIVPSDNALNIYVQGLFISSCDLVVVVAMNDWMSR